MKIKTPSFVPSVIAAASLAFVPPVVAGENLDNIQATSYERNNSASNLIMIQELNKQAVNYVSTLPTNQELSSEQKEELAQYFVELKIGQTRHFDGYKNESGDLYSPSQLMNANEPALETGRNIATLLGLDVDGINSESQNEINLVSQHWGNELKYYKDSYTKNPADEESQKNYLATIKSNKDFFVTNKNALKEIGVPQEAINILPRLAQNTYDQIKNEIWALDYNKTQHNYASIMKSTEEINTMITNFGKEHDTSK